MDHKTISKYLSLVLRHEPQKIGIDLDPQGWTDCRTLLEKLQRKFPGLSRETLDKIVAGNDKQRFAFSEDRSRIRASQGHSVEVDLALKSIAPPELLYHGTIERFLDSIRHDGLTKGQRHDVHLSESLLTATKVGERRGKPVILNIRSGDMHAAGHLFQRSENGVWLTTAVPPQFIDFPASS